MADPITCLDFFGEFCVRCFTNFWREQNQPSVVEVTLADILTCPGAPPALDGTYELTQKDGSPCTWQLSTPTLFIEWCTDFEDNIVYLLAAQKPGLSWYESFFHMHAGCAVNYTNDHVLGDCGLGGFFGWVGGYGGSGVINPFPAKYWPAHFCCTLEMIPPDDNFSSFHTSNGTKRSFSLSSLKNNHACQILIDTNEL